MQQSYGGGGQGFGGGGFGKGQRACFECGGLDHLARNCPSRRHVNDVTVDEPEVLFIGKVKYDSEMPKEFVKQGPVKIEVDDAKAESKKQK